MAGQVITFYSYKGGTGRTMALANVACLLANITREGGRVLMIDWDLEAPGLHRFFHGLFTRQFAEAPESDQALEAQPGLIDLFTELDLALRDDTGHTEQHAVSALNSVDFRQFVVQTDIRSLDLMKAGRFDDQYSTLVNRFDWEGLYTRSPTLFSLFAERLADEYQFVLIDSRTGLTDTSGVCTTLMPERLVVVFTPNRQSLTGVLNLVQSATGYRRASGDLRPLSVFPLPSRIEISEATLRQDWRLGDPARGIEGYEALFEKAFREAYGLPECHLSTYFDEVQLPHVPRYAFGEEIAVLTERRYDSLSLARHYETFAERLLQLAGPWDDTGVGSTRVTLASVAPPQRPATRFEQLMVLAHARLAHFEQLVVRAHARLAHLGQLVARTRNRLATQLSARVPAIVPRWLNTMLLKLFAIFRPILIPTVTLVVLMGVAYLFLRPPEVTSFYASAPAVPAGGNVQLNWSGNRVAGVSIDPPLATKPQAADGTIDATPDKTTEYTLTMKNWIGLSSTAKTTVSVVKIDDFTASATQLAQEGQEITLKWATEGASSVQIDPGDEIKDPKPSGEAKVHPSGNVTYTLTATGAGGVAVQQAISIAIGLPTIKRFEVTDPAAGARVFPGSQVKLNWQADGATKAVITADKGDVTPGNRQLDVLAGPPATVQPTASGDVTYTLTVSNAVGTAPPATVKVSVSPVSITQFIANPDAVSGGTATNLSWQIEGANDTTQISIDPGIGKVPSQGQRPVSPTDTTEYTLTVRSVDGSTLQQRTTVTVRAPTPVISVFTAPSASITAGQQVRLTWNVSNADSIMIRTSDGDLIVQTNQVSGSVIDNPPGPTTYILTATNAAGQTVKTFSVDVTRPGAPTQTPRPVGTPLPIS
jgi:cellulose biosynthesis protein BcsQ